MSVVENRTVEQLGDLSQTGGKLHTQHNNLIAAQRAFVLYVSPRVQYG